MSRRSRRKPPKGQNLPDIEQRAIRMIYRDAMGRVSTVPDLQALVNVLAETGVAVWIDLDTPRTEDADAVLREVFHLHPLLIEDMLHEAHVPKINDYGECLQIVLHGINFKPEEGLLDTDEVDVVLGSNYVITHHVEPISAIEHLWAMCMRDGRPLSGGADHVAYELVDVLVSGFLPTMDEMDEAIDVIEDEVFAKPTPQTLSRIFTFKRAALHLRRIIAPQREVLNRLARDSYPMIDEHDRVYFRSIYDQLVRIYDLNESLRDLASGALDTYLSVTSFRVNEVMKILTVFTALFMPISFLSGFFGMNFMSIPFDQPLLLVLAVSVMIASPVAMLIFFRRKGWM
jgi:magnesium transporter